MLVCVCVCVCVFVQYAGAQSLLVCVCRGMIACQWNAFSFTQRTICTCSVDCTDGVVLIDPEYFGKEGKKDRKGVSE